MDIDPFLVDAETEEGEEEADDHGREGASRRSFARIEAAEHAGARAAEIDGSREGEELEDVVALAEVVAEPPCEDCDEGDGDSEQAELCLLGDRFVVDRQNDVLNENRAPAVEVGRIRGDHEEDHEGHERAGDADGQDVAQGDRYKHLVSNGFTCGQRLLQLLGGGVVFRRLVFGEGLDVAFRHAFREREFLLNHFMDFLMDSGRMGGVVGRIHIGVGADDHQHEGDAHESGAPLAENAGHLLFMRVGGGAVVGLVAEPCVAVVDGADHADDDVQQVELRQFIDIEGVEETLAFWAAQNGVADIRDTEDAEQGNDDRRIAEVGENTLAAVGYHGRNLSAGEHDEEGDAEEEGHQQAEGLEMDSADGDDLRQMAVVDDEAAGDGGEEGVAGWRGRRFHGQAVE